VKRTQDVRTPIDAFIVAALEKKSLALSPEADRRTLDQPAVVRPHRPAPDARRG